ncbi:MAG: amidohydrolase family protein [Bacteroidetes bacterium]|nr:amidohydrolase family protein [Bacteroidota bacterium]
MLQYNIPLLITNDGAALSYVCVSVLPDGTITEIASGFREDAVSLKGVVIPGFVNTHCHLELSHLKNEIRPNAGGMKGFIEQLLSARFQADEAAQINSMHNADREMWEEGIVAVGDISNFSRSNSVKTKSKIYYHTFIELLGLNPSFANAIVAKGLALQQEFLNGSMSTASLTPHAPYSCPTELLNLIFSNINVGDPLSIHMQESLDELQFCKDKSGPLVDFFKANKISFEGFIPFGEESPLQKLLPLFPKNKLQLVHNTYTKVKCIHKHFPSIPFEVLVKAATVNGAAFLGMESVFGKIKVGLKPGLVLLENVNIHQPQFHDHVKCKRIQ